MSRFHGCPQMMQQGFNFPPMDIGAERVGKDCLQQVGMFMAHGSTLREWFDVNDKTIAQRRAQILNLGGCLQMVNRL